MMAEREIWRGIQEGLEAAIVNPGIIIGAGNDKHKATLRLFKQIATQKLPFYTPGSIGFISVQDTARACRTIMHDKVNAERYILVNETLSYKNYFERIAKVLHVSPPKLLVNQFTGKMFVSLDWLLSAFSLRKRGLTSENLKIAMENFQYSNEKFVTDFSFKFTPLNKTIEDIAQHIKK